ncbi:hypothetical protein [Parashewanella tropica]|uniref:hypothetical protein n=1 Tax=Parashewanella tropica TaxID=2547970 RepID=UPI00105A59F2|nr:hypothetical protein [Parashewanella tropica]
MPGIEIQGQRAIQLSRSFSSSELEDIRNSTPEQIQKKYNSTFNKLMDWICQTNKSQAAQLLKTLFESEEPSETNNAMEQLNELCGPNHNPIKVDHVCGVETSSYTYYFDSEEKRSNSVPLRRLEVVNLSDPDTMEEVRRAKWKPVDDYEQLSDQRYQAFLLIEQDNKRLLQALADQQEKKQLLNELPEATEDQQPFEQITEQHLNERIQRMAEMNKALTQLSKTDCTHQQAVQASITINQALAAHHSNIRCVIINAPEASHFVIWPDSATEDGAMHRGLKVHDDGRVTLIEHIDHPLFHTEPLLDQIFASDKAAFVTQFAMPDT